MNSSLLTRSFSGSAHLVPAQTAGKSRPSDVDLTSEPRSFFPFLENGDSGLREQPGLAAIVLLFRRTMSLTKNSCCVNSIRAGSTFLDWFCWRKPVPQNHSFPSPPLHGFDRRRCHDVQSDELGSSRPSAGRVLSRGTASSAGGCSTSF